ncbi:MAG TPA: 50S ribosomal protein L11 methyltransferase [Steroidobacteraceae bacterium]|jgi:ribosomal protein L11 methyltransferase|nr:50S ribosomal protein L11 methyltransferase [Steroidobacteraceae bacterium]
MPYLELSFTLDRIDPEVAEAACFDCGALSVTFSDESEPLDVTAARGKSTHAATPSAVLEPRPGEIRLWPRTRLQALFTADEAGAQLIVAVARALGLEPARLRARALADRAWEREWLRDFHALRFGRRLWVCPRHQYQAPRSEAPEATDAVVVRLDPGLAFGTGTHPSTALCLEWLESLMLDGLELIDYGCGSGLLAIAALKLGARRAYAFDVDPQALLASRQNAADNGVADRLELCESAAQLPRACDLLVANILSEVLLSLAPAMAALVAPRGSVLLAGILLAQQPEVAARYSAWFDMQRYAQRDGWVALRGQRH